MFVNLFASCFIALGTSVAINSNAVPKELPISELNETVDNRTYVVTGGYIFKHSEDSDVFWTGHLFDHDVRIAFGTDDANFYSHVYVTHFENGALSDGEFEHLNTVFAINYIANSNLVTFAYDTHLFYMYHDSTFSDLEQAVDHDDSDISLSDWAIYIVDTCYLTTDGYKLFSTLFTNQYTSHFVQYNGWFHLNPQLSSTAVAVVVPCYISWNNRIYQAMYRTNSGDSTYGTLSLVNYTLSQEPMWARLYVNGTYSTDVYNMYFTNMVVPSSTYAKLQTIGSFDYVRPDYDYTLTDLFINIADTPVEFITSLFSFELFGVPFFYAFLSLITAIALVFIIKKVL